MMYQLEINLLSPGKKRKLRSLVKFLYAKEYLELIMLTACVLAIMYLGAWLLLNQVVTDLGNSTVLVNRDFTNLNRDIRTVNRRIHALNRAATDYYPLTGKIADLVALMPADIKLTSFTVDRMAGEVAFTGIASTRESLLSFQAALSKVPWMTAASTPESQLFQKSDVPFAISAKLKEGILKPDPATAPVPQRNQNE